jgi:hypothetical protein
VLPSSKRVTPQRPLFFGYCIAKNHNKPGKKQSFENVNNQAIFTMDCENVYFTKKKLKTLAYESNTIS